MARFFRDAGYETVHVLPGTRGDWKQGAFYQFDRKYYFEDFDYAGPELGWGKLPDQYVLDAVFRKEISRQKRPLFIEYALVSSHAPWATTPPVLTDWSSIGRGEVYRTVRPVEFDTSYDDLGSAKEAYLHAIAYDLRVLGGYLSARVTGDALAVIIGDHQPVPDVTGEGRAWSVPIHVISRRESFLSPFRARGFKDGMMPQRSLPHPGMESFLPDFLIDFSTRDETIRARP
jgi:hypothetical protein